MNQRPEPRVPSPGLVRILGIDPGSQRTGVGIVDSDATGRCVHVHHAMLKVMDEASFPLRLKAILSGIDALLLEYQPDEISIERVFMARNPDSALKLGQARGAAICAVVQRDLPVHEYSAKEVKQSVVGSGGAEKGQVQHMVGVLLNLHGKIQADAADALAIALTHAHLRASAQRVGVSALLLKRRRG